MNWICSQIGAREHYAVPRVLHRAGKLDALYTDFWAATAWRAFGSLTGKKSLAARFHLDLIGAPVTGFNLQTLKTSLFGKKFSNPYDEFLRIGNAFGKQVVQALDARRSTLDAPFIFFGYDTGFLEPAQWVKERGGKAIVCQMDPSRFEVDLVKEEAKLWPGVAKRSVEISEAYFQRREEEWAVADLVMVNSEWTKGALIRQGVSAAKIVIVPLAYEAPKVEGRGTRDEGYFLHSQSSRLSTLDSRRTLRVLFLGQVILRKGIQHLIEAARILKDQPVIFDVVGSIGILEEAVKSAPSNMTFHGPISRDRASEFYKKADLFVLPTLSDGFALTQLEAMAHGLPVIATPNCGAVVTEGVDGMVVPARDARALVEVIRSCILNPDKVTSMGEAAKVKASKFNLSVLSNNLLLLEEVLRL